MTREKLMNVKEFQRALDESQLDAMVAASQANVFYTSGAFIATQTSIRSRLALTVLPSEGDDVLIVSIQEESLAKAESWIVDVRSYVEFAQSPMYFLADALKEKGLAGGRIGLEKRYLTAARYEELLELLPNVRFEDCSALFDEVRSIKTEGEIDKFQQAALATERAIVEAFHEAAAGHTERGLLERILDKVNALGGYDIRFGTLAAGDQSFYAYPKARERELDMGDLIRADVEGVFQGYGSDVARTAVIGRASEAQKDMYARHREVQRGAIEFAQPGIRACDVFEYCVQAYARSGIEYTRPYVGHGLGLGGHEGPSLQPRNTQELRPNMLICIEPAYLDEHAGGYQLEDLIVIKEEGAEILTSYANTQELFIIE